MDFVKTYLFLVLIITLFTSCNEDKSDEPLKKIEVDISYKLEDGDNYCSDKLIATINGQENVIIPSDSNLKLFIQLQGDFNNDGALDILLENRKGCEVYSDGAGISYSGNSYFIMTYDGQKFHRLTQMGNDWDGIEMKMIDDKLHFAVETIETPSYNRPKKLTCANNEVLFTLNKYKIDTISVKQEKPIEALKSINCDGLVDSKWEEFSYDLDGDDVIDTIKLAYIKSLGGYSKITFRLSNNNSYYSSLIRQIDMFKAVNRIGVLPTKTNGVHDLVINCNTVIKWDGFLEYVQAEELENREYTYRVFAKNGLIIRQLPAIYGTPVGKFDYGTEIKIVEKTDREIQVEEEEYVTIDGYWYKAEYIETGSNTKQYGYVFSGYLADIERCTLFSRWDDISFSRSGATYHIHGQCIYSFPIKVINENEVELIWSNDMDCVFDSGFGDDLGLNDIPEEGKPFAKYTLSGETLKATYYYPEWINAYNKKYAFNFYDSYTLNYPMLTDW